MGDQQDSHEIAAVARLMAGANRILFITGAGISADSGIPTYRGVGGLYDGDVRTREGFAIEEILSGRMFAARPELTWKYLWQIGAACAGAQPNAAHRAIAQLERDKPKVWVVTQNIDGLHRAAGTCNLVEVHGHAFELFCTACRHRFDVGDFFLPNETEPQLPPRCDDCGGVVRPNVVLFEENLPPAAIGKLHELAETDFDAVVSIGTSAMFAYINEPILLARRRGISTVEINPSRTNISDLVDHRIELGAAAAMSRIMQRIA